MANVLAEWLAPHEIKQAHIAGGHSCLGGAPYLPPIPLPSLHLNVSLPLLNSLPSSPSAPALLHPSHHTLLSLCLRLRLFLPHGLLPATSSRPPSFSTHTSMFGPSIPQSWLPPFSPSPPQVLGAIFHPYPYVLSSLPLAAKLPTTSRGERFVCQPCSSAPHPAFSLLFPLASIHTAQ
ncbi:hypothetical protein C8R44DRAFT_880971 [Mycena epipterygia]|nr:hypothetical protein C8R44DRAFT_880971 [Mycena epipterygia]